MDDLPVTGKLPYPPSINRYWKTSIRKRSSQQSTSLTLNPLTGKLNRTGKMIKTVTREPAVIQYVNDVYYLVRQQRINPTFADKLKLTLLIYPPDEKKRDIDNVVKCVMDSLQHAGIYTDDFKIWILHVERREVRK